jgi:hypothetical protein
VLETPSTRPNALTSPAFVEVLSHSSSETLSPASAGCDALSSSEEASSPELSAPLPGEACTTDIATLGSFRRLVADADKMSLKWPEDLEVRVLLSLDYSVSLCCLVVTVTSLQLGPLIVGSHCVKPVVSVAGVAPTPVHGFYLCPNLLRMSSHPCRAVSQSTSGCGKRSLCSACRSILTSSALSTYTGIVNPVAC